MGKTLQIKSVSEDRVGSLYFLIFDIFYGG